jgi:hypothetical protein
VVVGVCVLGEVDWRGCINKASVVSTATVAVGVSPSSNRISSVLAPEKYETFIYAQKQSNVVSLWLQ